MASAARPKWRPTLRCRRSRPKAISPEDPGSAPSLRGNRRPRGTMADPWPQTTSFACQTPLLPSVTPLFAFQTPSLAPRPASFAFRSPSLAPRPASFAFRSPSLMPRPASFAFQTRSFGWKTPLVEFRTRAFGLRSTSMGLRGRAFASQRRSFRRKAPSPGLPPRAFGFRPTAFHFETPSIVGLLRAPFLGARFPAKAADFVLARAPAAAGRHERRSSGARQLNYSPRRWCRRRRARCRRR